MSRNSAVEKCLVLSLMSAWLLSLAACGTIMLPPLKVASCKVARGRIVVQFTAPPAPRSLDAGLTFTEDGERMEGQIQIHGDSAEFIPRYGLKAHHDYVVRVEADNRLVEEELHVLEGLSRIQLEFSSPVDRNSLEEGLSLSPSFDYLLLYADQDCQVTIQPLEQLEVNNRYSGVPISFGD